MEHPLLQAGSIYSLGMQELIVRLKALVGAAIVEHREEKKDESRLTIGNYTLNIIAQTLTCGGRVQELSYRETEILRRLCVHRNDVVSTQNILLELWGDDSFFNSRSLHVFITKLRRRLLDDERIRIINVRGVGYKLVVGS